MKLYSFLLSRLSICIFLIFSFALAQTSRDLSKTKDYIKASPNLKLYITQSKDYKRSKNQRFLIQVNNWDSFVEYLQEKDLDKYLTQKFPSLRVFAFDLSPKKFKEDILSHPAVSFADIRMAVPKEERVISNFDLSVNKVNYLHTNYPELQGDNITISIKEFRFDSLDIDLLGKNIPSPISSSFISTHATNMATMMAGRGNSFYAGKGVASGASLSSSNFLNLLPDPTTYYDNFSISVQNHSYGVDPENYYGIEAMAYDEQVYLNEEIIHVFSAGNIGDRNSVAGIYEGIEGFANLTGNFKMAKNVLVIGAVDSFLQVPELSSKGPAYDGRIKPELVTYGQDGSSGAAAITSGIIALLQEAYSNQYRNKPSASLIRAVLMNGADEVALPGPDYSSGYGNINALKSLQTIQDGRFMQEQISFGDSLLFTIQVPSNVQNLKLTLAWVDSAAHANADRALVNDLDLTLIHSVTGQKWHPWILNSFPHPDSLNLAAIRGQDHLNNQEQISLEFPEEGVYHIYVKGHQVQSQTQAFSIAYEWEEKEQFTWTYPTATDHARSNTQLPIRWSSSFHSQTNAGVDFRFVDGGEWIAITDSATLSTGYLNWKTPDTLALGQLRVKVDGNEFLSDIFTISTPTEVGAELDCDDIFSISWAPIEYAKGYQLFTLADNSLTPLQTTQATSLVLKKNEYPSRYYAIAPIINDTILGQRSLTMNMDFQRAGCYITSFFAELDGDVAYLELNLGSLYEVASIFFEKQQNGQFTEIANIPPSGDLSIIYSDIHLDPGINTYRSGIRLNDGQVIYSDEYFIIYTPPASYLLFPNPLDENEEINILTQETQDSEFRLFDSMGRLIIKYPIKFENELVLLDELARGIYFYHFVLRGEKVQDGKLLVK